MTSNGNEKARRYKVGSTTTNSYLDALSLLLHEMGSTTYVTGIETIEL